MRFDTKYNPLMTFLHIDGLAGTLHDVRDKYGIRTILEDGSGYDLNCFPNFREILIAEKDIEFHLRTFTDASLTTYTKVHEFLNEQLDLAQQDEQEGSLTVPEHRHIVTFITALRDAWRNAYKQTLLDHIASID